MGIHIIDIVKKDKFQIHAFELSSRSFNLICLAISSCKLRNKYELFCFEDYRAISSWKLRNDYQLFNLKIIILLRNIQRNHSIIILSWVLKYYVSHFLLHTHMHVFT